MAEAKTVKTDEHGFRCIEVVLGTRSYLIREAGISRAREFRHRFHKEVMPLVEQAAQIKDVEIGSPADLLKLKPLLDAVLVTAVDTIVEMVFLYAPLVEKDREYVEENATEKQMLTAFWEVIANLALPLERQQLAQMITSTGPRTGATQKGGTSSS